MSEYLSTFVTFRYQDSGRILHVEFWTISDRFKVPFSGPQMQKRFHIHKEQGSVCLFIYITSRVFFFLLLLLLVVVSINTMLTPVSRFAHKNGVRIENGIRTPRPHYQLVPWSLRPLVTSAPLPLRPRFKNIPSHLGP